MLTIRELLEDKAYREYFTTMPIMPRVTLPGEKPWRVYVQREKRGKWAKKEFHTYREAFLFLRPLLKGNIEKGVKPVYDAAIQSKGIAFDGPAKVVRVVKNGRPVLDDKKKPVLRRIPWQPTLPDGEEMHVWCPYCRRPTVFGWFSRHHAFPAGGVPIESPYRRCTICGISERLLPGGY